MLKFSGFKRFSMGGVRRLGVIFLAVSIFAGGFIFGNVNPIESSFAVSIDNASSSWGGGAESMNGQTCTINYPGKYRFELSAGNGGCDDKSAGGHIIATCQLTKGDILTFKYLKGGAGGVDRSYSGGSAGGDACILYLNNTPLIGAGGRGGRTMNATGYKPDHGFYNETISYSNSSGVSSQIDNSKFSSGGGGSTTRKPTNNSSYYGAGASGNTISGCTAAGMAQSGSNYLDTSRAVLVEAPNDGNAVYFNVQVMPITKDESYGIMAGSLQVIAENTSAMVQKLDKISSSSSASSASSGIEAPIFTVVAGKSFSFATNKYDDMSSGSHDGVTVTNSTVGDGAVMVSGKINTVGNYVITINGKNFIFNVIQEPNSSNVTVILE